MSAQDRPRLEGMEFHGSIGVSAAGALAHEAIGSVEVRVAKRLPLAGHIAAAAVIIERSRGDGA